MSRSERFARFTDTSGIRGELRRRSVYAALYSGASAGGDFLVRLLSTAVLARLIVPEHFGVVMMAAAIVAVADQLKELGLSAATVQRSSITHAEVSNLFWINAGLGTLFALLLCLASPFVASYYKDPRLVAVTCALASTFLLGSIAVQHQALLTRQLQLGRTAFVRLSASVLSTALAIALAYNDFGYWSLVWREVSRSAFLALGMWFSLPWIPSLPSRATNVRPLLGFGANLTAANVLGAMTGTVDRFLVGRAFGAAAVGVYRQAYQLIATPTDQLLGPLYQVAQPALSMLQSDPQRFSRYYSTLLSLVASLTMPLSVYVAVYSFDLTMLLLGRQWIECAPIIMLLSLATFVRQSIGSTALILITRGDSRMHLTLSVGYNILYIAALLVGIRWGLLGIVLADIAVTYIAIWPRLYFTLRDSPVSPSSFLGACVRPAFASLAMGSILFLANGAYASSSSLYSLIMGTCLAPLAFFGTWVLLPGGLASLREIYGNLKAGFLRRQA